MISNRVIGPVGHDKFDKRIGEKVNEEDSSCIVCSKHVCYRK